MAGVDIMADFWHHKTVLVTGHTGFKGSWLSMMLQLRGANLIGYALRPPTQTNLFESAHIASGMVSLEGDIRDLDEFKAVLMTHRPDIIIHMAAQALVRQSYADPVETYATNVMGTVNVLEAARQIQCARVVLIITSDKCYDNKEWIWGYRENDPMGGFDPYSSSKGCAELITSAYRNSYFSEPNQSSVSTAVASARAGNVIGGGDWAKDRLIPDIIRSIEADKAVFIRNPGAIRPWQHVLDPLSGYICLIEKLWEDGRGFSGGWNFGPPIDGCKPVSYIMNCVKAFWGQTFTWQHDNTDHLHEANFLKLDCSKAYTRLPWRPKLDLNTALKWTIQWYKHFLDGGDVRQLSEKQIKTYEEQGN